MNISELETAKRSGLSFITIVLNDATLKLEKQMMEEKFGAAFGTNMGNPDFVQLAESFGVKGVRPNQLSEFEEVLKETLNQRDEMTLIDVILQ